MGKARWEKGNRLMGFRWGNLFRFFCWSISLFSVFLPISYSATAVKIKNIARIQGVYENQLLGYGLVVGLNGTGDRGGSVFTMQSVANMLQRMGIKVSPDMVRIRNVAAVVVTANLPPFAKSGSRLDVLVSSIGDATSLQGGTLLLTGLQSINGDTYALAQGPVSIGGFDVGAAGGKVRKNHPTVGRIPNGAVTQKQVDEAILSLDNGSLNLILKKPDFTTAARVAEAINGSLGEAKAPAKTYAMALDAGTVRVEVPSEVSGNLVAFISTIENLTIIPDTEAKVVINERTGTIVMGEDVGISTVAVSHGSLSVEIKSRPAVSQPQPFSSGETVVTPNTEVIVDEQKGRLILVPAGVSIGELVRALNAIGGTPRDLIAILQAIKEAGALHAELVII